MAIRYIEICAGTSDPRYPQHRSNALAAGIFVDSNDAYQLKYDSNGTDTTLQVRNPGLAASVTAATFTPTPGVNGDRITGIDRAAGTTITLPAATGSGAKYQFAIKTTLTSGSLVLQVANANDYFRGFAYTTQDAGGAGISWGTANTGTVSTESDTLTWNRTTTGIATQGDYIEVIDAFANVWLIETEQNSNGTEATPFSAAV